MSVPIRPDSGTVQQLVSMGFPETRAQKAVFRSHNCGVEPAVNWLVEHGNDADIDEPLELTSTSGRRQGGETVIGVPSDALTVINPDGDHTFAEPVGFGCQCKTVLVVAKDLGMSQGKTAAQCAHAAVGLYKLILANRMPWLAAWESQGEKTVVVSTESTRDLETLADKASNLLLPTYLVSDAGRTEVEPGAITVLGIAGTSETVDQVTGHLPTLR